MNDPTPDAQGSSPYARPLHSPTIGKVALALAKAQGAFPLIPRDRSVVVTPRKRKGADGQPDYQPPPYTFTYAPLATVLDCIRGPLADQELALTQAVVVVNDKGHEAVRTVLVHSSGEFLANETPLFVGSSDNASQGYASGMTYARRYGVTSLVCVAADDDDDANGAGEGDQGKDQARTSGGRGSTSSKPEPQGSSKAPAMPQPRTSGKPAQAPATPAGGGTPLSDGAQRQVDVLAKRAGLSADEVRTRFAPCMENVSQVLADLRTLSAEAAAQ